jgi:hypothetical protein
VRVAHAMRVLRAGFLPREARRARKQSFRLGARVSAAPSGRAGVSLQTGLQVRGAGHAHCVY